MSDIEYMKASIRPKEETIAWLECNTQVTRKHGKTFRGCDHWINVKLYFGTDDIRIYWNRTKCTMQVRDDEPETMKRSEFTERIVKPSAIWFNNDFTRVHGTQEMLDKFFDFCKERFNDDLR